MVNCATAWIALSCFAARPLDAHTCQYVVPTMSATSRTSASVATRVIPRFTRSSVRDERQRDPGQRDDPQDPADDDERLEREPEGQSSGEELREPVTREQRDPEPAHDEKHEDEDDGGC